MKTIRMLSAGRVGNFYAAKDREIEVDDETARKAIAKGSAVDVHETDEDGTPKRRRGRKATKRREDDE